LSRSVRGAAIGIPGFVDDAVNLPNCVGRAAVKLSYLLDDPIARSHLAWGRHLFQAVGLALQVLRCPQSRLPNGGITGTLGEFPTPIGKLAQLSGSFMALS
jgi:hypothetical protein